MMTIKMAAAGTSNSVGTKPLPPSIRRTRETGGLCGGAGTCRALSMAPGATSSELLSEDMKVGLPLR